LKWKIQIKKKKLKEEEEVKIKEEEERIKSNKKTVWQWLDVYGHKENDWCEYIINGDEQWVNMNIETCNKLDKLEEEGKEFEYEFSAGNSKFKIDLKNMIQITLKTSNTEGKKWL